ncbi:hypothetical protein [Nocardioides lijunqiniae]|uniref:hypothetical protein n=1 Tax=Nocardioides lijunqiniae TaxID=2760832 RepID=UPI001878E367|nr:hypothetical protein [Nocardioides lijunqiniae]
MTSTAPKPPNDLKRSGRALWRAVLGPFDLDEHERQLLHETCRTRDLCDRLQTVLDAEGVMSTSSQGVRVHPAAVELRQQRITLARLLAALNVPSGEEEAAPRAPRGVYAIRGGAG